MCPGRIKEVEVTVKREIVVVAVDLVLEVANLVPGLGAESPVPRHVPEIRKLTDRVPEIRNLTRKAKVRGEAILILGGRARKSHVDPGVDPAVFIGGSDQGEIVVSIVLKL